jgi:D-3-phosphoglycerate dehydrogenase
VTSVAVTPRSFRTTEGRHQTLLGSSGVDVRLPDLERGLDEREMRDLVDGCVGLIVGTDPVTADVLDAGPLRVVVKYGSGVDNIDLEAAEARDVHVADTRGENARSVAELAVGLLFALARHVVLHDRRIRDGSWQRDTGTELRGRRLGLVGYGAVGREVVAIAEGLGMDVIVHDPYISGAEVPVVDLDEVLSTSDAVSLHAPLTAETAGLLGAAELDRMRPDAVLINTARGGLVDEHALAERLRDGRLAGAAFDDFAPEPSDASPLLGLDRVIASPHAGAATVAAAERTGVAAVRELLAGLGMEVSA